MSDTHHESIEEEKRQNDDYTMTVNGASVGDIEIDYEIRGNEYEAEQFWMELVGILEDHEDEYGDGDG